jgi:hypothetical protein
MTSEKKPSIYYDRSTIGSSNELDEYGVWVKSEPRDFSSGNEEISVADTEEFPDFDIDLMSADKGGDELFSDDNFSGEAPAEDTKEDGSLGDDLNFSDLISDSFEADTFSESGDSSPEDSPAKETSFDFKDLPEPDETPLSGGEDSDHLFDFAEADADNLFDDSPLTEDISLETIEDPEEGAEDSPAISGSGDTPAAEAETAGDSPSPDLSTQLLMKIAEELSSIRSELSSLKQEFRVLQRGSFSGETAESQGRGFFDEEDDEKISLTGDELDTILHTAEPDSGEEVELLSPVEEPSPEALSEEDDDFVFEDDEISEISADDITIDLNLDLDPSSLEALNDADKFLEKNEPEQETSPDFPKFELPLEEISLETGEEQAGENPDFLDEEKTDLSFDLTPSEENAEFIPEPEEALNLNPEETAELEMLMEEGLEPMTPLPEDTSYLDDDPLVEEPFAEISLDLSDAVIDEPDLSGKIKENPPEEPALENIALDDLSMDELSEDISMDFDMEEAGEDIQISIPSAVPGLEEVNEPENVREEIPEEEEEIFPQVIPEGFKTDAEDIPDFLEDDISLAEENLLDETAPEKEEDLIPDDKKQGKEDSFSTIPSNLQLELKTVLSYMDQLLESLPEEKIEEFAKSEYFDTYKKLFKELGIV